MRALISSQHLFVLVGVLGNGYRHRQEQRPLFRLGPSFATIACRLCRARHTSNLKTLYFMIGSLAILHRTCLHDVATAYS